MKRNGIEKHILASDSFEEISTDFLLYIVIIEYLFKSQIIHLQVQQYSALRITELFFEHPLI